MDNLPVFDSSEEYRTWKALVGKPTVKKLDSISTKVLAASGFVHPAILIALMDAMVKEHGKVPAETLKSLVSKSRPQDCTPAIRASEILIADDQITAAAEILSKNVSKDGFRRYMAEAELYSGVGDKESALASAKRALDLDPTDKRLYEILEQCEPGGPWRDIECVYDVIEGRESRSPKDPRYRELYAIYKDWFGGNKDAATDRLINSEYYTRGDWEFMLVSARTSVDEKDWRSAKMVYSKIVDVAPKYVLYEAAETFIAGHDPEEALNLYDKLDQTSLRALQGRILAYAHMGSEKDVMNAIYDYLDNENSGTEDYSELIGMLITSDNLDNAKILLDRMARSNKRDPAYLVAYSRYLLERGDVRGASRACRGAALHARGDTSVRVLVARMKLTTGDLKGAEKECDKIMKESPDDLEVLILKKDILVEKKDIQGALEVCRRILDSDPTDVNTMITLSGALSGTGDDNGAMMMLRNVLRIEPSRENAMKVVNSMLENGMYREAMFLCYDLEKDMPNDPMIRRLRGNAEYALGEYLKASVSYASAAELDPHDPVIWHSKGMADEARGDLESAEASYNKAVLLDLNESEYWISKAAIQERLNDPYGAVESLNRAIELDPGSVYPMVRKAVILENDSRYDEALYFLNICSSTDPSNPDVALMRARILREKGDLDEALEWAKKVHDTSPSEDSAIELASCLAAQKKMIEAIRVLEESMAKNPDSIRLRMHLDTIEGGSGDLLPAPETNDAMPEDPVALAALAESSLAMSDYRGALKLVDRALSVGGEEVPLLCLKADILVASGDIAGAQNLIGDAVKETPKSGLLHEKMGDVKMAKSEYRGALQEYEKAISLGLNIPEVLAKKGDAQQGLGYYDRSIDSYAMAVSRDENNTDLRFTMAMKLYERGYMSRAESQVRIILEKVPDDARSIILLAKIAKDSRKDAIVMEAYKMFKTANIKDEAAIREMFDVLVSAGREEEARSLRKEPEPVENLKIKRKAEMVLRRAYVARISPYDEDFLMSLGLEGDELEEVQEYLRKGAPYGDIVPGSSEFQKMERLSNEVLVKMNWKDLENDYRLPLEKVFMSGAFKDVDEAKRLVAYVNRAMVSEVVRDDSLKMVLDRVQGRTIMEIMKSCRVGVYQARQIQVLLGIQ